MRTGTFDFGTHGLHQLGTILHMRFAGGEIDARFTGQHGGGKQCVLGGGDGEFRKNKVAGAQCAAQFEVFVRTEIFGTHLLECGNVRMHRTLADDIAAGVRHFHFSEARQHGAEQDNGRAKHGNQFARQRTTLEFIGTDLHRIFFERCFGTEVLQNLQQHFNVAQARNVGVRHLAFFAQNASG